MSDEMSDEVSGEMSERGIAWDAVARLYDSYVRVAYDTPFFLRETVGVGETLELMCGTGRLTLPLAEAGARLACVDGSAEMLAVLREKLARHPEAARHVERVEWMDVRRLDLGRQFDLVILPFQSFGELVAEADQRETLARIYAHTRADGRFICTLHNPVARRETADGQLRLLGRFPLEGQTGSLFLWGISALNAATRVVEGTQFYEEYDGAGVMRRKSLLDIRFALIEREAFEAMAAEAGFRVAALYGDYDRGPFVAESSPYMIWTLEK